MVTQPCWAKTCDYNDIYQRIDAAILVGTMLNWGLKKWLNSNTEQIGTEKW